MSEGNSSKRHVAILGGGPCGLYAGRVLSREGYRVTILDKGERPGGLATSCQYGDNWYDMGVHMFHAFDKEIFEDVKTLMGDERIEVDLDARIKWNGHHFRYPLQFQDMIRGIPFFSLCRQVFALFGTQLKNTAFPKEVHNAEEALIQLYGKPLYKYFFKDFTHRYWGIHPRELSATFIKTKMPKLTAVDVIKRGLQKVGIKGKGSTTESALSQETLHYSRSGAETMTRHVARAVVESGGEVIQQAEVKQLLAKDNRITSVRYEKDGVFHELDFDACISTIPINLLATSIEPGCPEEVSNAATSLRYKPIAIYGLLVKKPKCMDAQYVYYRSRVFHRVGEPKNAGVKVNPPDHTVLIVEMTCEVGDEKWRGDASVKERLFRELAEEGICEESDIVELHITHYETGYPIFALGFEPHLDAVKQYIQGFENLQTTGRQGAFTYPNMHSAMRMGYQAAENIIKGQN
ncbi:MAG: FAD-dependent oxidoreductase [Gammaproteobacteria bacterium]